MKIAPAEREVKTRTVESTSPRTTATSAAAASSNELRERIQRSIGEDLGQINRILDQQLQSPHPYMGDILQHAGHFRGKQIRPVLLLLCQKSLCGQVNQTAHALAAVVEMIHTATLVHDDVLDNASSRRHWSTINHTWNTETSVLLGDYLFSRAFRLAASTGDAVACECIGHATDLTCAGELHQIAASRTQSLSERDYFRVIRGKTGQLFGLSCYLGARAAHASPPVQRQMRIGGIELGMAFQITDDVLDFTGEKSQTGKDSGNDLANRRLTLPWLRALQLATPAERDEMRGVLAGSHDRGSGTGELTEVIQRLAAFKAVQRGIHSAEQTAQFLVDRCLQRLTALPDSDQCQLLRDIARFAIQRKA